MEGFFILIFRVVFSLLSLVIDQLYIYHSGRHPLHPRFVGTTRCKQRSILTALFSDRLFRMDLQTLSQLFATTYNPDPNVRKAAELQIRKVGGSFLHDGRSVSAAQSHEAQRGQLEHRTMRDRSMR